MAKEKKSTEATSESAFVGKLTAELAIVSVLGCGRSQADVYCSKLTEAQKQSIVTAYEKRDVPAIESILFPQPPAPVEPKQTETAT
jgi:hypothetical protein